MEEVPVKANKQALASLILGLIAVACMVPFSLEFHGLRVSTFLPRHLFPIFMFFGFFAGIAAVVLAAWALIKKTQRKGMAVGGLAATLAALFLLYQIICACREISNGFLCSANLMGVYHSVSLYAEDNDAYPQSLEQLKNTQQINERVFHCPSSKETRQADYFYFPPSSAQFADCTSV